MCAFMLTSAYFLTVGQEGGNSDLSMVPAILQDFVESVLHTLNLLRKLSLSSKPKRPFLTELPVASKGSKLPLYAMGASREGQ